MSLEDRLHAIAATEVVDEAPEVSGNFVRGLRNGLIISVVFFWAPVIFLIAWLVNR